MLALVTEMPLFHSTQCAHTHNRHKSLASTLFKKLSPKCTIASLHTHLVYAVTLVH